MNDSNRSSIAKLADAILDGGCYDAVPIYESLEDVLPPPVYRELGAMLELCPTHHCDIQICLDDMVHGNEVYNDA